MTDGLRKSHLRKAHQVGLSEVGLPDIYLKGCFPKLCAFIFHMYAIFGDIRTLKEESVSGWAVLGQLRRGGGRWGED